MRPAITFLNIQLSNSRDHFKDSAVELVRARDQKREETGFRKIGSYIEIKSCGGACGRPRACVKIYPKHISLENLGILAIYILINISEIYAFISKNESRRYLRYGSCKGGIEYAKYVAKVRKYTETYSLNEAVKRAISECIKEGILAEFLQQNRAEVEMVSILEYDKELEEKKLRKAEYEAGVKQGMATGIIQTARRCHLSEEEILAQLCEALAISEREAAYYLKTVS